MELPRGGHGIPSEKSAHVAEAIRDGVLGACRQP